VVADPFAGSGTTALAAMAEDVNWLLIEREPDYAELARARTQLRTREHTPDPGGHGR